jgi:hypothetical protein
MNFLGAVTEQRGGAGRRANLRLLRGGRTARDADPTAVPTAIGGEREPVPGKSGQQTAARRAAANARSRILVAGADSEQRAAVLRELSEALPSDTQFGEARAAWEVLEQAPSSGVVMLAGDLTEVTAESLMHVLGHRHPSLPVVALGVVAGSGPWSPERAARVASAVG